jgi:hypothetical protein
MTAPTPPPAKRQLRKVFALGGVLALAMAGVFTLLTAVNPESASALEVNQCNGVDNDAAATTQCHVTVVNNLTNDPTTTFSVVTVNGVTTSSPELVTAVHQCNGSGNKGGNTVLCTVTVINNIAIDGPSGATGASVNQCVGSGESAAWGVAGPNPCSPYPATADPSTATIVQCNGSGNGGGLVAPSGCTAGGTTSASLSVTVDQCNGSANGGGGRIQCSASMATNVTDTTATGPDSGGGTPGSGGGTGSGTGIAWLPPSGASAVTTDARLAG